MERRVLMVATVPSMIGQFNMHNIDILLGLGYQVDVAADFTDISVWPVERIKSFKEQLSTLNIECIQLDFSRSPLKLNRHIQSYREIKRLIKDRKYSFIHTHTPIASAIVRIAAHKMKTKVIYTAHGFHFYKCAPIKNWIIFYPLEKYLSKYTDILITINKEDYSIAAGKFKAKKTAYVPGVGINVESFEKSSFSRAEKRKEIGVPSDAKLLISVGELSVRKNHKTVVSALQKLSNEYWYVIVGRGDLEDELKSLDNTGRLKLLGYRNDIAELLHASDLFVFPSIQEGLPVSLMEAMASGLPVVCSDIRGNDDLVDDGYGGFLCDCRDVNRYVEAINQVSPERAKEMCIYNISKIKEFDITEINKQMHSIYEAVELA